MVKSKRFLLNRVVVTRVKSSQPRDLQNKKSREAANSAKISPKETARFCEDEAAEVEAGEDEDEDEDDDDAEAEDAFPATVVIFNFMPCPQWPAVPQAKYLVPGLFSFTTSFPLLMEFTALLMSQFL